MWLGVRFVIFTISHLKFSRLYSKAKHFIVISHTSSLFLTFLVDVYSLLAQLHQNVKPLKREMTTFREKIREKRLAAAAAIVWSASLWTPTLSYVVTPTKPQPR